MSLDCHVCLWYDHQGVQRVGSGRPSMPSSWGEGLSEGQSFRAHSGRMLAVTWALWVKSVPRQSDMQHHLGWPFGMGGARAGSGLGSQSPLSDESALTRGGTRALVVGPCRWLPAGQKYRNWNGRKRTCAGQDSQGLCWGWGLLSRKALPSGCSWPGELTVTSCVLPVGPVCPPVNFAPVLQCSDLPGLHVAKVERGLRAQLLAH